MNLDRSSPWFVLIPLAAATAMVVLVGVSTSATADKPSIPEVDGAVVVEVPIGADFNAEETADAIEEAVRSNPGLDVVLEPMGEPLGAEDRRAADEAQEAAENEAMRKWIDEQIRTGVFIEHEPAPCLEAAKSLQIAASYGVVGCEGAFVGLPAAVSSDGDLEDVLVAQVNDLLAGLDPPTKATGFYSMYSGAGQLNSLSIDKAGVLHADFSKGLIEELPPEPTTDQERTFNLQLYGTMFQFDAVNAVEITVAGKCPPMYVWYETGSCSMSRGFHDLLWQGAKTFGIEERTES